MLMISWLVYGSAVCKKRFASLVGCDRPTSGVSRLCPPAGNKITDAGVLRGTPKQHQDVVVRSEQRAVFASLLIRK